MTLTFLKKVLVLAGIVVIVAALSQPGMATPTVQLAASVPSPQPLGTTVMLTASATDTDPGTISYRFEIGLAGSTLVLVRDFSVATTFLYTPTVYAASYEFEVIARNNSTQKTASFAITPFKFTPLATGTTPVITTTANPLVAIFSSPPCAKGGQDMRVSVLRSGSISPFYTPWQPCGSGQTLNFLVAGMRVATSYTMTSEIWNGSTVTAGSPVGFTTGTPSVVLPSVTVVTPATLQDAIADRFLLMSFALVTPTAFDLQGNPVWYYPDPSGIPPLVTRPVAGGAVLMLAVGDNSAGTSVNAAQILREIDLGGNVLRETNATRVSEQVSAMSGIASTCQLGGTDCLVGAFDHEAIALPNGHTLVEADEEKIFTDGTQGSSLSNPVDIIGDIIIDLDPNWQVAWYWRAFDHLNANRAAILGETCTPNQGGCPPLILTTGVAQDWLHGNAIYYTPNDGSMLFSMRHQDWIIKIDYANGIGSGNTLWTLGNGGDFTINSTDPYPWFSHQHDPGFVQDTTSYLALFDNGNTRVSPPPLGLGSGDSRGYVMYVDQTTMQATPLLLADLGYFSSALGTAELLANGDYHFEAGFGPGTPPFGEAIEIFPTGNLGFTLKTNAAATYRSFRMTDLYTPPPKD